MVSTQVCFGRAIVICLVSCVCSRADSCQYPAEARALVTDWSGQLAAQNAQRLSQSPNDAALLFLNGVSLLRKDTPAAIAKLQRAIVADPAYPWPYFMLIEIEADVQPDPTKLAEHIQAYHHLCPANSDAFRYLSHLTDEARTREFANQFRALLERENSPTELVKYRDLWSAEFRSTPPPDFDRLRARVRADLEPIAPFAKGNEALLVTLKTGYELVEDSAGAKRADREIADLSDPAQSAYREWNRTNRARYAAGQQDRHEERREAEDLASKWPQSLVSWGQMLGTALDREQAQVAGEQVLRLLKGNPDAATRASYKSKVAASWLRFDIRLNDVPNLAEESVEALDKAEAEAGPLASRNPQSASLTFYYDLVRWDAWNALVDASLRLHDLDRARAAEKVMASWLTAHPPGPDSPQSLASMQPQREAFLGIARGRIADAEGRKTDALAFYQRVLIGEQRQYPGAQVADRARELWKEQGGTEAGWLVWSKPLPHDPAAPSPRTVAQTATLSGPSTRDSIDRLLVGLHVSDLQGKPWTIGSLQGKITVLNVWATWCAPCVAEMPEVQQLFDTLQSRPDIQLISLNIDENPGLADLFVKKHNYTFPVLLAEPFFSQIQPAPSIPQTWITDKAGSVMWERRVSGSATKPADWSRDVFDQLKL